MARITIEDCTKLIPNRFELVVLASKRARQIYSGVPITVEQNDDKNAVISLREIAGKNIDFNVLKEDLVTSYQQYRARPVIEEAVEEEKEEEIKAEEKETEKKPEGKKAKDKKEQSDLFAAENIDVED